MRINGPNIGDDEGRGLLLRGCNLGGSSKQPAGRPGSGFSALSLKNPRDVSFIGRPFPEDEADAHFKRLAGWGFTFMRFVVTWEALEHAGPGIYDEAYLAYLRKILLSAEKWGISVFIDPHQDAWSRWTGGDGAPAWTLESLGMDLDRIDAVGAAITRQRYGEFNKSAKHPEGDPFPRMMWPGNCNRYAAATLFTLFFGGNAYAPEVQIEGKSAQDWLQEHYLAAWRHCFRRLKNCAAIAGWGIMNEPHQGFIGCRDAEKAENPMIPKGPRPSPFQTMLAASGHPVKVPVYPLVGGISGYTTFNPQALSLFKEGFVCPWKQAGVWTDEGDGAHIVRKDHFAAYQGRPANFIEDFLKPFMLRFIETMKEPNPETLFFLEGTPLGSHPAWKPDDPPNTVNAFHHYDGLTLFTKSFVPWFTVRPETAKPVLGRKRVAAYYSECLAEGRKWTAERMGNMPCLLGEFGLPFDLNGRKAFKTGDYRVHEEALSMYYDGIDANLLHSTIWTYTPDNTRETGDNWNDEDLSIFSEGEGRAMGGWLRPYPMAAAGTPLRFTWNRKKRIFSFRFQADDGCQAPTVIFLPALWFGAGSVVEINPALEFKREDQRLLVWNRGYGGEAVLSVRGSR
jgi:hypothetical protein